MTERRRTIRNEVVRLLFVAFSKAFLLLFSLYRKILDKNRQKIPAIKICILVKDDCVYIKDKMILFVYLFQQVRRKKDIFADIFVKVYSILE